MIADSRSVLAETQELGDSTLQQLHGQRQTLVAAQGKVGEVQDMAVETRSQLKALDRKTCTRLVCLYSTIGLLSLLIIAVAWRELTNRGRLLR